MTLVGKTQQSDWEKNQFVATQISRKTR